VTIRFEPGKSGTEMVVSQTGFKDAASARGHKEGWSSALASFAKVFAASRRKRR
jgi:Activator of Hsp90 ATPase homolog 1-like protein